MKVTFIQPELGPGLWQVRMFKLPPGGLLRLASATPKDWEFEIIDENIKRTAFNDTDLVAISVTTANAKRAYEVAKIYQKKGIPVILGGIHPSMVPEEAKKHADSIVIGEADLIWGKILDDFKKNKLKKTYKVKCGMDLSNLPLTIDDFPKRGYATHCVIQTSRGCPNACEFCAVSPFSGRKVRHRPVKDIEKEIKNFKGPLRNHIIFIDDNLTADKAYAKELFTALIPLKIKWAAFSSLDFAKDDKLLELADKSGCKALYIGFESISEEAFKQVHKANLIKEYKELARKIHNLGITIEASFVFGFDCDKKDIFKKTVDFCNEVGFGVVQFSIITPYPGTALFKRLKKENRMLSYDWNLYDASRAVFTPKNMSVEELEAGLKWCYKTFYSFGPTTKRLLRLLPKIGLKYYVLLVLINNDWKKILKGVFNS